MANSCPTAPPLSALRATARGQLEKKSMNEPCTISCVVGRPALLFSRPLVLETFNLFPPRLNLLRGKAEKFLSCTELFWTLCQLNGAGSMNVHPVGCAGMQQPSTSVVCIAPMP